MRLTCSARAHRGTWVWSDLWHEAFAGRMVRWPLPGQCVEFCGVVDSLSLGGSVA